MQSCLHTVDHQGMACVVPPLETDHALGTFGKPVDQLSFTLVTPLGADHDDVATFVRFHVQIRLIS